MAYCFGPGNQKVKELSVSIAIRGLTKDPGQMLIESVMMYFVSVDILIAKMGYKAQRLLKQA